MFFFVGFVKGGLQSQLTQTFRLLKPFEASFKVFQTKLCNVEQNQIDNKVKKNIKHDRFISGQVIFYTGQSNDFQTLFDKPFKPLTNNDQTIFSQTIIYAFNNASSIIIW